MAENRLSEELEEAVEHSEEVAERVAERGRRTWRKDQYIFVFVLILATLLSTAFLGNGALGVLVTLALVVATLVVALNTSGAGPRYQALGLAVGVTALVLTFLAGLLHQFRIEQLAYAITMTALVCVTPYVIARRIAQHPTVNIETIVGAADIYLLIGLFFTTLFGLIGLLIARDGQSAAQAFLVAARPIRPGDLPYFSFTTLTTVGYGDVTASTSIGRMLAVTEALIGQLYLVTIVALLVANIGRTRQQNAGESAGPLTRRD